MFHCSSGMIVIEFVTHNIKDKRVRNPDNTIENYVIVILCKEIHWFVQNVHHFTCTLSLLDKQ